MVAGDRPRTDSPNKAVRASSKSLVDTPFRYSHGRTASRRRVFFRYGGRISDRKQRPRPARSRVLGNCTETEPTRSAPAAQVGSHYEPRCGAPDRRCPHAGPERLSAQPGRLVGWQSGHGHGSDRSSRLEKLDSGMELSYRCSWRHSPCLKSVTSSSLISAGVAAAFKSAHTPDLIVALSGQNEPQI